MRVGRKDWQERELASNGKSWSDPKQVAEMYSDAARSAEVMGRPDLAKRLNELVTEDLCASHASTLHCLLLLSRKPMERTRISPSIDEEMLQAKKVCLSSGIPSSANLNEISVNSINSEEFEKSEGFESEGFESEEFEESLSDFSDLTDIEQLSPVVQREVEEVKYANTLDIVKQYGRHEKIAAQENRSLIRDLVLAVEGFLGDLNASNAGNISTEYLELLLGQIRVYKQVCTHPISSAWTAKTIPQFFLACELNRQQVIEHQKPAGNVIKVSKFDESVEIPFNDNKLVRLAQSVLVYKLFLKQTGSTPVNNDSNGDSNAGSSSETSSETSYSAYWLALSRYELALRKQLFTIPFLTELKRVFRLLAGVYLATDPRMLDYLYRSELQEPNAVNQIQQYPEKWLNRVWPEVTFVSNLPFIAIDSPFKLELADGNLLTEFFPVERLNRKYQSTVRAFTQGDQMHELKSLNLVDKILKRISALNTIHPLI